MKSKNLAELSHDELLRKVKEIKTAKLIYAFTVGVLVALVSAGVYFYNVANNGFVLLAFLPIILMIGYLIIKNSSNDETIRREVIKELESRGLK